MSNPKTTHDAWRGWWDDEGSGMRPLPNEDTEQFARRITEIAWSNGAYCSQVRADLESATVASLLHTIAMIREAGGWQREMMDELPAAVAAMRERTRDG